VSVGGYYADPSNCLAVVFTILVVAGNTMAMSIRERTGEVAILKTLGFRRNSILYLLVGESVAIALLGGILGALGRRTALKYGWKLGDRIHLRSPGYSVDLDLTLRGIYTGEDESLLGFRWDYLNEAQGRPDKPMAFLLRAHTEEDVPRLMQIIDNQFRNGPMETRTQPLGQWVLDFLAMIGNVKLILVSVSVAIGFGLSSTLVPAYRSSRISISDALRYAAPYTWHLPAAL
jgi:ABC-type antimicrobial peptide transport system permease subunit